MTISLKTRITLWGRGGGRCSFLPCRRDLVLDAEGPDAESLVGEAAHIVAEEPKGPRGDSAMPVEERNRYPNLILLCSVHHKLVDDQPEAYPSERLHSMKSEHEQWVRQALGVDAERQRDDELYAWVVDEWAERVHLNQWDAWGSWVLGSGQPQLWREVDESLFALREWMFKRVWPRRYRALEDSLHNFQRVVSDFQEVFRKHAEADGDSLITKKFYRIDGDWDEARSHRIHRQYEFHVDLVQDLFLELSRAANYVCDAVRQTIDPSFRLKEGVATAMSGPHMDLKWRTYRPEYIGDERTATPYPGLEAFKTVRATRDRAYGSGTAPSEDSGETS